MMMVMVVMVGVITQGMDPRPLTCVGGYRIGGLLT